MSTATPKGRLGFRERAWRRAGSRPLWERFKHLLGVLRIRRVLKRMYCRLLGPNGGSVEVRLGGNTARFYVHTQALADSLSRLQGEGPMIEFILGILRPGDCFYDVGAEMGLYTLLLAGAVGETGHVIAFEPYADAYERLLDNLELNGVRNVRVFQLALGGKSGAGVLFSGREGFAPTLRDPSEIGEGFPVAEHVTVVAGDALVAREKLPIPRAVKMDVEGVELAVIQGLSQTLSDPACQALCCEIHPQQLPAGVSPQRILDLAGSLGFTTVDVRPRGETLHATFRKPPGKHGRAPAR